ncbi:MAG: transporter substrate-binding domain-containing protein [Lachnospiraceae bacterium]|nr:transporter substrate-binding domain-containing protein [Lachnospiraceae bacterium]
MFRKIIPFLLCVISAATLSACGKNSETDVASGVLRVGVVNGNDKYASVENDEAVGIEPNLARKVAEKENMQLELTMVSSLDALYTGLSDGSFDLAFGRVSDTTTGLDDLVKSRSYGKNGYYFVTKKYDYTDNLTILGTTNVGITTSVMPVVEEFPGYESTITKQYNDTSEMVFDISSGTIEAGICSEREAFKAVNDAVQIQEALNGPRESYIALMPPRSKLKKSTDNAINDYYNEKITGEVTEAGGD